MTGLLCSAAFALATCAGERDRAPDILLISLDTVRADAVEPAEAWPPAMPALAAFAKGAVRFRRAYTPIPFTLPAHMTLLTGLEPESHGVDALTPLSAKVETLAESLRAKGYRTVGLHTSEWVKGDFGFGRGFDRYEQIEHGVTYAERVAAAAFDAVEWERRDRAPVFLFLHLMDAHSDFSHIGGNRLPYYATESDRRQLGIGRVDEMFCLPDGRCASDFLLAAESGEIRLAGDRIELLRKLYAAGLAGLDRELAELFAELGRRGSLDRAVIVVTSDHGEEFFEHGRFLHSQVFDETSRVPLILRLPHGEGGGTTIDATVGLVDVAPTLLAIAGVRPPSAGAALDGRSLLPVIRGGPFADRAYVLRDKLVPRRFGLVSGDLKLLLDLSSARAELYDLRKDPAEADDLAPIRPEDVRRLAGELHRLRAGYLARTRRASPVGETEILTREERARLRSLGYLEAVP